jgi:hypothetical protein
MAYCCGPLSTGRDGQAMSCRASANEIAERQFSKPAINPSEDWWPFLFDKLQFVSG